jgi:hypothetical protein
MISVIKCDNDGAWLRKNKNWMPMVNTLDVRMFYVSHDRYEDSAEAESTVRIVSVQGKKGLMARNAPETDWDIFWDSGVWFLNRTIAKSASSERSPDGDQERPIKRFTHRWYSQARCNSELAYFEMPHTPLLVHDGHMSNAQVGSKVAWMVAKSMFMDQVICFNPWTGYEIKMKSFDAVRLADGISYRSYFSLGPAKKTKAERPIAEDFHKKVTIVLPPPCGMPEKDKQWKLPSTVMMVKHVLDGTRVPGLVITQNAEDGEDLSYSVVDMWDSVPATQDLSGTPVPEGRLMPTEMSDGVLAVRQSTDAEVKDDFKKRGDSLSKQQLHVPLARRKQPKRAAAPSIAEDAEAEQSPAKTSTLTLIPETSSDEEAEEVEKILDHNVYDTESDLWEFRVRWQGWGPEADSWHQESDLPHLSEMIGQYRKSPMEGDAEKQQDVPAAGSIDTDKFLLDDLDRDIWHRAQMAKARAEAYEVKDENTLLTKVMNKIDVKPIMYQVYKDWAIMHADIGLTEENWPQSSRRPVQVGMRFPKPQGVQWDKMVALYWASRGYKANAASVSENNTKVLETDLVIEEVRISALVVHIGYQVGRAVNVALWCSCDNPSGEAEALAAQVRSKDNLDGVVPPPSNLSKMWLHRDAEQWMQGLADELNSLTDIGAVSHGHTRADLISMGITAPLIATQVVFENKFKPADHAGKSADDISAELRGSMPNKAAAIVNAKIDAALKLVKFMMDGRVTTDMSFAKRKARVVAVGSKKNMQQGIHFFDTFGAMPRTETANVMSALIVMMKLYRKAFNIKIAFNWAKQKIKLALDYPYGMPQYAVVDGHRERLYNVMVLHKNMYGKPDGSQWFEEERNGVWLEKLNEDGFTCVLPF